MVGCIRILYEIGIWWKLSHVASSVVESSLSANESEVLPTQLAQTPHHCPLVSWYTIQIHSVSFIPIIYILIEWENPSALDQSTLGRLGQDTLCNSLRVQFRFLANGASHQSHALPPASGCGHCCEACI